MQKETFKETVLKELVKPSYVQNNPDSIQVNDKHNRIIMAVGYPRKIKEGWLDSLITSQGNFDISMHIQPSRAEQIITQLNTELVKQEADIMAFERKGIVNPSLKLQYSDTYKTLEQLQKGEEKLFSLSLYVNAKADNKKDLDLLTRKINSEMNSMLIIPKTPYLKMAQALKSILPIMNNKLNKTRTIPSGALAACFPFTSSFMNIDNEGIVFGVNADNQIPLVLDPYSFANYNGLILGTSGGGKSFATKLLITRNLMNGVKVMVIDPQGEYNDLVKNYEGQIVEISRDSDSIINPLDLLGQDYGEKMLSLMDLFKIMCGELTEVQKNILDKSLERIYREKGIIASDKKTWNKQPPILNDLYDVLIDERKRASRIELPTYDALSNRIRIYAKGTFSFLNKMTNLDLNNDFISFNIVDMPPQVKPLMMYMILDFVHKKMQKDKERKMLVIDEAWSLLRFGEQANYIFEMIKTARKFNLGITIITQEVNDLIHSKAGNTILANTAWKLLLRQEPAVIKELTEKFYLNKEEQKALLTATEGEGFLIAMNDRLPIKVVASKEEHEIITTNPEELRKRDEAGKKVLNEKEDEKMEVYRLKKPFYEKNSLTTSQVKFLKLHDYTESRQPEFGEGRGKTFLISKPPANESIKHHFMVQLIAEELRKHTENVSTYSTLGPDIIYQLENKEGLLEWYALEIETGTQLKNPTQLEAKIRKNNNSKIPQYKQWWFVVTDKSLKRHYEKYKETMTRTEIKDEIKKLYD